MSIFIRCRLIENKCTRFLLVMTTNHVSGSSAVASQLGASIAGRSGLALGKGELALRK